MTRRLGRISRVDEEELRCEGLVLSRVVGEIVELCTSKRQVPFLPRRQLPRV